MQIKIILMSPNLVFNKLPDGKKINLASLGNGMQLEMLAEITSNFEYVRTSTTRDSLLLHATNLNMTHHCYDNKNQWLAKCHITLISAYDCWHN